MIKNLFSKTVDQSSPQKALEGFRHALIKRDWRTALRYLSPEAQKNLIGALLMGAGYATDGNRTATPRLIKVMQKHGLRKHQEFDVSNANLPAIIRDLMKWSDKYLPDDQKLDLVENVAQTEYSEYRIDDDRAYVKSTCKGRRSETRLKRIDRLWYLI